VRVHAATKFGLIILYYTEKELILN